MAAEVTDVHPAFLRNILFRSPHTRITARRTKRGVSQGWASGHAGPLVWKWKRTGIRTLPRAALNMGVTITERATTPTKKAGKDQDEPPAGPHPAQGQTMKEALQSRDPRVSPDEKDPHEAGGVDRQNEEGIRIAEGTEEGLDGLGKEQKYNGEAPGEPERQHQKGDQGPGRHPPGTARGVSHQHRDQKAAIRP